MIGRDASESIRSGRSCKTSHGESCGRRTENPLPSGMGSRQGQNPLAPRRCNRIKNKAPGGKFVQFSPGALSMPLHAFDLIYGKQPAAVSETKFRSLFRNRISDRRSLSVLFPLRPLFTQQKTTRKKRLPRGNPYSFPLYRGTAYKRNIRIRSLHAV